MSTKNIDDLIRGTRNQQKGAIGESIAHRALIRLGFMFVHPIATPYSITRGRNGRVIAAAPSAKVAGDFRAIWGRGQSVLVEVKNHDGPRLTYSTLEKHQHEALAMHQQLGGLSLLIWIHKLEAYVMDYPVAAFKPRTSISIETAALIRRV